MLHKMQPDSSRPTIIGILERISCLILRTTVNNLPKIGSVKSQFKFLSV